MPERVNHTLDLDTAHMEMFDAVQNFFRYEKRHPDANLPKTVFDDAYYDRVAELLIRRVKSERKFMNNPNLV